MKTFAWTVVFMVLLLSIVMITACSTNTPPPTAANPGGSNPTSAPAVKSPTRASATSAPSGSSGGDEECSLAANIYGKAYKSGDSGPTPANFPPPPPGSHLCGSAANEILGTTVIYTTGQTSAEIIQYYKSAGEKAGFKTQVAPTSPGVSHPDLQLSILRDTRQVADVKALGNKQVFQITYPK